MADYCTLDEVRDRVPSDVSLDEQTTQGPTPNTIESEITLVTNQVNAAFKKAGIGLPITDADVLGLLKLKCSREVAYQVMAIRAAAKSEKVEPLYFGWHAEFTEPEDRTGLLEQIEDGGLAGLTGSSDLPWSSLMDADETDPTDSKNPEWTKGYVP